MSVRGAWHAIGHRLGLTHDYYFPENQDGFIEPGCNKCAEFLVDLLARDAERTAQDSSTRAILSGPESSPAAEEGESE